MIRKGETIRLLTILALAALTVDLTAAEKKGADLVVRTRTGQESRGELIAVKPGSILLKEAESGVDLSLKIEEISLVRIVHRPELLKWTLLGAVVVGIALPVVKYYIFISEESSSAGEWFSKRSTEDLTLAALIGVIVGGVGGAIIGGSKGVDEVFPLEDPLMRIAYLQRLRYLARVRDPF